MAIAVAASVKKTSLSGLFAFIQYVPTTVRSELRVRHRHPHRSPWWLGPAASNSSLSGVA